MKCKKYSLEAEAIEIMREVVSEAENPVMLYSVGKDSAVMTKDTVGAFTADIEGSLGLIVSGHQTETDPSARLALAKFELVLSHTLTQS